ncbi:MAG: hypothetical protein QT11_C0001G0588 [archaeon GW2011_AR20]|nr:MAG: hypothetical protein QT11_C0001G0588 [archaeon GW2011_AR20]MBS3160443.1 hypothetical protein [Candidatus Woesearchaeota archaeon]
MKTISKDTPLAEITLRKYEQPNNLIQRELIKKICLGLGLLQPGDSRDVIVDVLLVLINSKEALSSEKINDFVIELRKKENLPLKGIAGSNIRRQLKRLKDLFLIENVKNEYRISENEPLIRIFEEKIEKFYIKSILDRIKDYLKAVK